MPKISDYQCAQCGNRIEHLAMNTADVPGPCDRVFQPDMADQGAACGGTYEAIYGTPGVITIVRGNADYAEREKARLTQRSTDHWIKHGRSEAIDRERTMDRKARS